MGIRKLYALQITKMLSTHWDDTMEKMWDKN